MDYLYKTLAFGFICVVILVIVCACIKHFASEKSRAWKIDVSAVICFAIDTVVFIVMGDLPYRLPGAVLMITTVALLFVYKEK